MPSNHGVAWILSGGPIAAALDRALDRIERASEDDSVHEIKSHSISSTTAGVQPASAPRRPTLQAAHVVVAEYTVSGVGSEISTTH